ncbi:MAG: DeoR/GlpR family DNA-binding transcription regulator [Lachnospiraceae bacterium]|nr:DeoR/GlpR family DNA-binding transcription regulator [Lachnospiraceae bacterium]
MLALERRNRILEELQIKRQVVVGELARSFKVSEETIRRDLDRLDKEGLAKKSYGGAVIIENSAIDLPFNIRKKRNIPGKQRIAELISELVEDGDHITLDPSTTAVFIARALKEKQRLTVITNSLEVMIELSDVESWNVYCSGGTMKEGYLALTGPRAIEGIGAFNTDKAILSCKGLDAAKGITDGNELFCEAKRAMLDNSREHILAVDHSKFGTVAFSKICDTDRIDIIVTDEKPDDSWLDLFNRLGIKCIY